MSNNFLAGAIPAEPGQLSSITTMRMDVNSLSGGAIPSELGLLSSLLQMNLRDSDLSGAISLGGC